MNLICTDKSKIPIFAPLALSILNSQKKLDSKFSSNQLHYYAVESNLDPYDFLASVLAAQNRGDFELIKTQILLEMDKIKNSKLMKLSKQNKNRVKVSFLSGDLVLVKTLLMREIQ